MKLLITLYEELKNCYQFRKVKIFRYRITTDCEYKKRTKEEG